MITFACVWMGNRYGYEYVAKLRNMIHRNAKGFRYRFICLTDHDDFSMADGSIEFVKVKNLGGWWGKMRLFDPNVRGRGRCIYFDLDTVIVDSLFHLVNLDVPFGVCANFTKRAGSISYPCGYGSCVMTFDTGFGGDIWDAFNNAKMDWMQAAGNYGDQWVIERLHPNAVLLQDALPRGFFVGRREFTDEVPAGASVMIFAGSTKPHNVQHDWVRKHWK